MNDGQTVASFNIQCLRKGLSSVKKRRKLRDFMLNIHPKPNVILLQEYRFTYNDCLTKSAQLEFLKGPLLWNAATYSALDDSLTGGTVILIFTKFTPTLQDYGVIVKDRAQYAIIELTPTTRLGIINIYGYNHTGPLTRLWQQTADHPLPPALWIMGGNFSFVESLEDKQGGNNNLGHGFREVASWNNLLIRLQLQALFHMDEFCKINTKAFTWDNRRPPPRTVLTRLDRFYLSKKLHECGGMIGIWST